jgi:hypothetical protein
MKIWNTNIFRIYFLKKFYIKILQRAESKNKNLDNVDKFKKNLIYLILIILNKEIKISKKIKIIMGYTI